MVVVWAEASIPTIVGWGRTGTYRSVGLGSTVGVLERPAFSGGGKNVSCGGCNGWALSVVFVGWKLGGGLQVGGFSDDLAD